MTSDNGSGAWMGEDRAWAARKALFCLLHVSGEVGFEDGVMRLAKLVFCVC